MVNLNKQQFENACLLLPWYVTGKLTESQKEEVEQALKISPELQQVLSQEQQLAQLIQDDNEVLDVVTITTQEQRLDNLLTRINLEPGNQEKSRPESEKVSSFSRISRLFREWFGALAIIPTKGWVQVALALFVITQVAILSMVFTKTSEVLPNNKYVLVTDGVYVPEDKTVLIIHFTHQAGKKAIDQLFEEIGVSFVDHPEGSKHYRVVLSESLHEKELDSLINRLENKTELIQLIGKGL